MANRISPPTLFAGTNPSWSLSSLDANATLFQGVVNDSSNGWVNGMPTDTGTLNAYIVTLPYGVPTVYRAGMYVVWIPLNTNTGPATLTVTPLGSQTILDESGNALAAGAIVAGRKAICIYDTNAFCLLNSAILSPPPGSITMFGGAVIPSGWLLCDGSSVATAAYPALFSALGYNFGGSGANFNLPNFSAKFPYATTATPGASGGSSTIAIANLPAHSHPITDVQHTHAYTQVTGPGGIGSGTAFGSTGATTGPSYTGITTTQATGSGAAFLPPYLAVSFIIKT